MTRREQAQVVRVAAADLAATRIHPQHIASDDEHRFRRSDGKPSYLTSYTKGLRHSASDGLIEDPKHFQQFVRAIDSGEPRDFRDTPLGNARPHTGTPFVWRSKAANQPRFGDEPVGVRGWESQGAGRTFDLEGPDAQAVTMPPVPSLGSDELTAEMAEVYVQALLRDMPFTAFAMGVGSSHRRQKVQDCIDALNELAWFEGGAVDDNSIEAQARRRTQLVLQTAFRGITFGDDVGPYISQFLLAGNGGINKYDNIHAHRIYTPLLSACCRM